MSEPPLLALLDAFVRSTPGPAGFTGSVCIGVQAGPAIRWWLAELGAATATTTFLDRPRVEAGALLLLTGPEADLLLAGKRLPKLRLSGDPRLFRRFVDRYVRQQSAIDLRAK